MSIREFDFERVTRAAEHVEAALLEKEIPEVQRAIMQAMFLHSASRNGPDKTRCLTVSLRAAADWMRKSVSYLKSFATDHSSVAKALQAWCDRGVMQVAGPSGKRTWWLAIERMQDWYDIQPDSDELPVFSPVSTGVDRCRPVLTSVDRCRPLIKENEKNNNSFSSSSSKDALGGFGGVNGGQQQSTPVDRNPDKLLEQVQVPDAVWMAKNDLGCWRAIKTWFAEEKLGEKFREAEDLEAANRLVGAIVVSRTRTQPLAFFATCIRNGLRPDVMVTGRQWIAARKKETQQVPAR